MAEIYTSTLGDKSGRAQVRERTSPADPETQGKAAEVKEQAMNKVVEAKEQVQHQAKEAAATQKSQAVNEINAFAQALRTSGQELEYQNRPAIANYTEQMAEQLERVSQYINERDVDQLLSEAADFARRRPEVFLGGAFVFGVALGRFLSSSNQARYRPEPAQPLNVPQPSASDYSPSPYGHTTNEPRNFVG